MGDDRLHGVARKRLAVLCNEALNLDLRESAQRLLWSHGMRQERGNRPGVLPPRRFGETAQFRQMTVVGLAQC
ncbi:MAG: hypothetical protein U1F76_29020 [Candidatus Competibacteraceae bacterium]